MTSVLESSYIRPSRPYSINELNDTRENFIKKINLSSTKAFHKNCGHFYFVKENGRKEKELSENNDNVGNCSCCWKLNKTPKNLQKNAEDLVNIYSLKFNSQQPGLTYDLLDIEISFYKWLYVERYEKKFGRNDKV
jgi:hypothetical protein